MTKKPENEQEKGGINLHPLRVFADCQVVQFLRWPDAWIQEKPH
jgi:hypothetical protein